MAKLVTVAESEFSALRLVCTSPHNVASAIIAGDDPLDDERRERLANHLMQFGERIGVARRG